MSLTTILKAGADSFGLPLSPSQADKFELYYKLLDEKNKVMNLTAIEGEEDTARLHFLDCLALLTLADMKNASLIDVGTGAGFPGVPLAIAEPTIKLTLLDAQQKRVNFLTELTAALDIDAPCLHARAEEAAAGEMRDSFDFAVSRALARLNILCELCMPFVRVGGVFIAMKSADSDAEIKEAKRAVKTLGGAIERVEQYSIPGSDITRCAVFVKKLTPTPKGYPRRFAKIQKSPLI